MNAGKVFREVIAALDQAEIPYMLTGSFASNLYGNARATQDIDLVIRATPDQLSRMKSLLPEPDYYFDMAAAKDAAMQKSMFNILSMEHGWKIDLIFLKPGAYAQEAFSRRAPAQIDGVALIASTAEDLIIAKLDWARMGESLRQINDVAGILKIQQGSLNRAYIEKWIHELGLTSEWARACQLAAEPGLGSAG
jgi:putative nucleotidyltransferase-like protein